MEKQQTNKQTNQSFCDRKLLKVGPNLQKSWNTKAKQTNKQTKQKQTNKPKETTKTKNKQTNKETVKSAVALRYRGFRPHAAHPSKTK